MTDDVRCSGSTPGDSTSGADVIDRAKAAHARRWEVPRPSYRDPVPTGVVELGDWASEYLPELLAEVERLRGALDRVEKLAEKWLVSTAWDGQLSVVDRSFGEALLNVLRGDQ